MQELKANCVICGREILGRRKYCFECKIKVRNKRVKDKYRMSHLDDVRKRNFYKCSGRFSGLDYDNSTEKIKQIKEKYRDGVTKEMIEEMVNRFI